MRKAIFFDLDGTLADFYNVEGWLDYLMNSDPTPYRVAKPLTNMNILARTLNNLQRQGYIIGVVSWLSRGGTQEFNKTVTETKRKWLNQHLKSVHWDEIHIIPYGTPKYNVPSVKGGYLFDDEKPNRKAWRENGGEAFSETNILEILKGLKEVG